MSHFNSFTSKELVTIPVMKMKNMIRNLRPRHITSCVTDRTSPTVIATNSLWLGEATPGLCHPPQQSHSWIELYWPGPDCYLSLKI